jgi:Tfp pilus assembly protein PilF
MNRFRPLLAALLAATACKTAAPVHPLAVEHNTYGVQYLEQGDVDKAQRRFELALEYNEAYPEPHNNLCLVWIKRGQYDRAKAECIKAIRLNNDFAQAHNNLGYIYLQEKSLGKAHDSFRNALRINPGYLEARYNLCLALRGLKRKEEARVCYDKVIETNASVADPYNDLCVMDIEDSGFTDAVQYCGKAVELDPKFAGAWFNLGRAYQGAGKHCEAQEAYRQCIAVEENHAECRNNLASAHRHCALTSSDLKEIKEEVANENSAASNFKLGLAEREKGLVPEAERHFKKCLKLDGRFGLCHCQLAEIKRATAEHEEAKTYCRKCVTYTSPEQVSPERDMCEQLLKP